MFRSSDAQHVIFSSFPIAQFNTKRKKVLELAFVRNNSIKMMLKILAKYFMQETRNTIENVSYLIKIFKTY